MYVADKFNSKRGVQFNARERGLFYRLSVIEMNVQELISGKKEWGLGVGSGSWQIP